MKRIIVLLAALIIPVSFSAESLANFPDTYGFSAQGIARGNAVTAIVNDWSSVYYNMSGLGKTPLTEIREIISEPDGKKNILDKKEEYKSTGLELGDELAINYLYSVSGITIDIDRDCRAADNLDLGGIVLGLVWDVSNIYKIPGKIVSSARFGMGLAVPQTGNLVEVNDIDIRTHNFLRYGREASRIVILAGAGFGFLDDMFGIGVGTNVLMGGQGKVVMKEAEIGPDEQTPQYEAKMNMKPTPAPVAGLYIDAGKILKTFNIKTNKWYENIQFGANYRGEVAMELDPFDALAQTEAMHLELDVAIAMLEYYTPNTYTAGIAYGIPLPGDYYMTWTFDYEFQQWSGHRVSSARELYYEKEGRSIPEFKDIHVWKTGVGVKVFKWMTASGGFFYRPHFVPSIADKEDFNFLDNDTYAGSLGLELIVPPSIGFVNPVTVNLGFQYQYLKERTVTKYNPTALNPNYKYGGTNYITTLEVIFKW